MNLKLYDVSEAGPASVIRYKYRKYTIPMGPFFPLFTPGGGNILILARAMNSFQHSIF
jgi:hypothetical protein